MNAAKQAAWLFCTMIALACSGWYFASSPAVMKLDEKTLLGMPDSIVTGLTVRQFSPEGTLANFLETPEMESIPQKNTHLLKSPHIILNQKDQQGWDIRSEKAESINRGQQITFINQVVIHQNKGLHNQESTFRTEELTYFPKKKFATTALAIIFEQPGSIVHSTGMNAYLEDKRVELLSKTRATYEPSHA